MATATYYISDFSDKEWLTGFHFIGVEFEYPEIYNNYVTTSRCINRDFENLLKEHGIFTVKEGNWDEKFYVASDPQKSWLGGKVLEINRDYHIDHNFKYYPHKVVSMNEFVKIVKDQIN